MAQEHNTFYVTTPIYYVNAKPHLGTTYSTVLADVLARWHRLSGTPTFFLTGTDEHGQKVAEAAAKSGKDTQQFVDELSGVFASVWQRYDISYSCFMRTTAQFHKDAVRAWIKKLIATGDIYKDTYEGWYCTSQEAFLTDKDLTEQGPGLPPLSNFSKKPAQWVAEECYYFRLSAYQERLLQFYKEHPDFIVPRERMHEVVSFVEGGLKDLSISRKNITWGIPFPGDESFVTYVWADALNNYITAIGYGDETKKEMFAQWWPADVQVMAKDIVRFHAVFWPAFLMASQLPMPHKLLVHGWIKVGDEKMSKSLGNVIDPVTLLETYGVDQVRYYLTRYLAITQDAPFGIADFEHRINTDLANDLSNLLHRVTTLAAKYGCTNVTPPAQWGESETALRESFVTTMSEFSKEMERCYFHQAYAVLWRYVTTVNRYVHDQEPWKVAAHDMQRFATIISAACHAIWSIGVVLWPVMPTSMEKLCTILGAPIAITNDNSHDYVSEVLASTWQKTFTITPSAPLFVRCTVKIDEPVPTDKQASGSAKAPAAARVVTAPTETVADITIDEFAKVALVVGQILSVAEVPKSDKLYCMQVDCGQFGTRQICAGVKKFYAPDALVGRKTVFIVNLQPRALMGITSHGMMCMATNTEGVPTIVAIDAAVAAGTRLK